MNKTYGGRPGSIDAVAAEILDILDRPDSKAPVRAAAQCIAQARDAGECGLRYEQLKQAQRHMQRIDPRKHGRELQQLQGQVLALQGRGGDRRIAHVTPGEVVVPRWALTPELMTYLAHRARRAGVDPNSFVVGHGRASVNPRTGQEEFDDITEDPASSLGSNVIVDLLPTENEVGDDVTMLGKRYDVIPQDIPPDQQPPPKIIPPPKVPPIVPKDYWIGPIPNAESVVHKKRRSV
jgi:hypothetical protein